ncbi:M20/M25/M40 family metallo-hydrolase [Alkalibacillus haloalkaliphilus]|uniref:M20/M25/M40 family metallo-hydrolase n=1 Tax=Alkalibacillus haloalkaliphilus TaxID=94136 RepID=UPI002935B5CD|nr:M20/M25/M40 family metallo-hydrolase [Alkalibacillus haloalkaliphilus]MDV2582178.1 M20/M25/M40 family metallo-hydrolase [Alkalibacillus haloalkaliphilus]
MNDTVRGEEQLSPVDLYEKVKDVPTNEKVEIITKTLVGIKSVNGTYGEVEIANYLIDFIKQIPYFDAQPERLWEQGLQGDHLGRKNVFALIKGKQESNKTVLYHSHMDTVGVDDFGSNQEAAFKPDVLTEQFAEQDYDEELKKLAQSGEWMFGRGSVDMKSGIAVHLVNLMYFSEQVEHLNGNVLVMFNPVEENEHTGVIESVNELLKLRDVQGYEFVLGINNDFVTSLYEGDQNRYIYTGAVGKLLPCFYIYGREAHVGETLTSVDPTLISATINRNINNNMDLAEEIQGELVLPPSCLYQRDQKDFYNVQTALSSQLYFNYFVYKDSPQDVMNKLIEKAKEACVEVEEHMVEQHRKFSHVTEMPTSNSLSWNINIYSYDEYIDQLTEKGIDVEGVCDRVVAENSGLEKRELCFQIVEALQLADPDKTPKVIIFFAPPYCPHNYLREEVGTEKEIIDHINEVLSEYEQKTTETFKVKKFFPFLSDSSYLSLHESDHEIESLIDNFPKWEEIYPVPVHDIRSLNIPSINMGVYGQDAHQRTERVYKPYTFGTLPFIIRALTEKVLNN